MVNMKYTQPSFSVPPANLRKGTNRHGQTWDDIFNPPSAKPYHVLALERELQNSAADLFRVFESDEIARIFSVPAESIPDATGDSTTDSTGHTCNGTYKTFSAAHCPYCWSEHAR